MIGMNFPAFLTLLVLGLIGSFVVHVVARYRVLAGLDGFLVKWVAGWIGGWLGSPVLGHWGIRVGSFYFIPSVLGAFTGAFLIAAAAKALSMTMAAAPRHTAMPSQSTQFEMRKAS